MSLKEKLFAAALVLLPLLTFSQTTDYYIDPSTFQFRYLTFQVKKQIDSIRTANKLPPLLYDTILERAALDQANYLTRFPQAGHQQNGNIKKADAAKRISFYGGRFAKVGEAITPISIQQPIGDFTFIRGYYHINTTYQQTARNLVNSWMQAQGSKYQVHPVLNKDFNATGLGITIDTAKWIVNVVETFGSGSGTELTLQSPVLPDSLRVTLPKELARYSRDFKEPKNNRNLRIAQRWTGGVYGNKILNGYFLTSYKTAKRVFSRWHRRTGLAMESTPILEFDNEKAFHRNPSRITQRNLYKQDIPSFVKGRRLMKMSRQEYWRMFGKTPVKILGIKTPLIKRPQSFILDVSSLPEFDNILLIRKGRLCDILGGLPLPAASMNFSPPLVPYQSLAGDFFEKEKVVYIKDTVTHRFYYKRGEMNPDRDSFQHIVESIPVGRLVKEIRLDAHASVEGNQVNNEALYNQRGERVKMLLEEYNLVTPDVQLKISATESWDLFFEQIKDSQHADLAQKPQGEIRDFINAHKNDTLVTRWLDEERYSNVFLVLNKPEKVAVNSDTLANRFNQLIAKPVKVVTQKQLIMLYRLQLSYYQRIKEESKATAWSRLQIPADPGWASLQFNELMFRASTNDLSETDLFNEMQTIGRSRNLMSSLASRVSFNNVAFIFNHYFYHSDMGSIQDVDWPDFGERNSVLYFKENRATRNFRDQRPDDLILLDLVPKISNDLRYFGVTKGIQKELRFFYLTKAITTYRNWSFIQYMPQIRNLLNELWRDHVSKAVLTDEERIRWALYFNQFYDVPKSEGVLRPIVKRDKPDQRALMIWISIQASKEDRAKVKKEIIAARKVLTHDQWIDLVSSGIYLNNDYLEDYRIRRMYEVELHQ